MKRLLSCGIVCKCTKYKLKECVIEQEALDGIDQTVKYVLCLNRHMDNYSKILLNILFSVRNRANPELPQVTEKKSPLVVGMELVIIIRKAWPWTIVGDVCGECEAP